ncbi:keratin-associated protein 19-2-like [Saccostrea echinata]|uniref:keratin-associated protein 19-2-like n=1 Tax=Saccostrea echinata TaxID=191078 RepID=UPI002A7F8D1D|nr:keratin-associated protein 19-2-like [Saccostrea echinata]
MLRLNLVFLLVCVCVALCQAGGYGKWRPVRHQGYGKKYGMGGHYSMWSAPSYYDSGYSYGGVSSGYPVGYNQGISSFGYSSSGYIPSVGSSWSNVGYAPSGGVGLSGAISSISYPSGSSGYYNQGVIDPYSQGSMAGSYMY